MSQNKYRILVTIVLAISALSMAYAVLSKTPVKGEISAVSEKITIDSLKENRDLVLQQKQDQENKKNLLIKDKDQAISKFDFEIDKANKNITSVNSDLDIAEIALTEALKPTK